MQNINNTTANNATANNANNATANNSKTKEYLATHLLNKLSKDEIESILKMKYDEHECTIFLQRCFC